VTATFTLDTPAGVNFDLFVTCGNCGDAIMASSQNAAGVPEEVQFHHRDIGNVNDNQTVTVEIRFVSATTCGGWHLTVQGHTAVPSVTCGPT
jgi:hypothetical protein